MTGMEEARSGRITDEVVRVAGDEGVAPELLSRELAAGRAVIMGNSGARRRRVALGRHVTTKVNANIGTSSDASSLEDELVKLDAAVEAGADAVMDLSTGGDLDAILRAVLERSPVPVGTVPIYGAAVKARRGGRGMVRMTGDDMLGEVRRHAEAGVDFVTVHAGVTREVAEHCRRSRRLADVVSRGGAFLMEWMSYNDDENPFYERYDDLMDILAEHDVAISLGDGLRPGALADANDTAQIAELVVISELVERARERNVQAIVEGPGHVPLHLVASSVELEKSMTKGAPFYVLGRDRRRRRRDGRRGLPLLRDARGAPEAPGRARRARGCLHSQGRRSRRRRGQRPAGRAGVGRRALRREEASQVGSRDGAGARP